MKTIILLWITTLALCVGCSDNDNELPAIKPRSTGTLTDNDGIEYIWVRYGDLDWMASNYNAGTPYYEQNNSRGQALLRNSDTELVKAYYTTYGNLYTYEEAVANAPAGWRLPTDEDWKKLEQTLGMSTSESNAIGWRGSYEGELMQQKDGINLRLCGSITLGGSGSYLFLRNAGDYGFYWTSTVDESYKKSTAVYFRRIRYNSSQIERDVTTIADESLMGMNNKYMGVRYVRDAK